MVAAVVLAGQFGCGAGLRIILAYFLYFEYGPLYSLFLKNAIWIII